MSERARILVIDDEPHPRYVTVRQLEQAGHAVTEAATGQEGLRLARELRPDLILLDVVLPDLDGFEVCRRIKDDPDLAHIAVILLSGKRIDSDSLVEGVEGGANGYILRGTPTREFLARVDAWLRLQRLEHRLRESESWRELAIAGSNGGIWHVQLDPNDPAQALPDAVYLSPRLKQFIGYEEHEFPDSIAAWEHHVHPEDLPKLRESAARHRRGESALHELEYRIRHRDGSLRWIHTRGRIERDAGGRPTRFAGMDWDITERKLAEETLRWNQVIVSSISDPISYVDRTYTYRAVNETYCRYARRPAREIVGLTVVELLGREAFEGAVRAHLDRCFAGHEVHYQAWFDVPDQPPKYMDVGYYPVLDERGTVVGAVVNSRDITERKKAEEALRRQRDLVAQIMETSPVGIVVLDRDGRITFVNAQVEQVIGLARDQIVQMSYNDPTWRMVDETGRPLPNDRLPFPRLMRGEERIYGLQQGVDLPATAGYGPRRLLLSMNAAPLYDASGTVDGVVVTVEDVTERVRLQEQVRQHAAELEQRVAKRTAELQASQAALLRAERLAIAGKLAASLTHEISNPLQSVIGCLGLAQETLEEGGDVRQYLEIALPELRRVARIVARLRDLGRPPSPLSSREPADVGELLEQVQALVRKQCQDRGIRLDTHLPPGLPQVHVVPDQVQQVFLNLTLNAIEAEPRQIDVLAEGTDTPAGVRILFRDSGMGISNDTLPHVFDPFFSTKAEGLGLGLAISQEIVQQHGGRIEVESELGQGATFTVWLPAHL